MSVLPTLKSSNLSLEDRVAVFTMTRDDVRNELTGSGMVDDICHTIQWANESNDVSVLVITGQGKAFSAGGNIKDMANRSGAFAGDVAEVEARYRAGIQRMPLAIHNCEVPIIAAVNGAAIGAGCDLACMCDIRIASEYALFGETFVNLGIIPGDGGAWFLQRLIGYQRAAEMAFTGKLIKSEEAKDIGLVLEVVAADELMTRSLEMARTIAAQPPQALRYTKRLLKQAQRMELKDFLDLSATYQGICHNTEDHQEAVHAFLEQRKPVFTGK